MRLPITVGDYQFLEQLGAGAFGTVYRARIGGALGFSQEVAVKVVDSARSHQSPEMVAALAREASFLSRIQHPNIVAVRRFGDAEHEVLGRLWLMEMELVRGRPMSTLLRAVRRAGKLLPIESTLSLLLEGADALRYAHSLKADDGRPVGLVHRDLKPENLIVSEDGRMKVLDFGIAWAEDRLGPRTESGVAKGTPVYMSPEQARGQRLDGRSDLYSLGAIAFEMLTGELYVPVSRVSGADLPSVMYAVVTTKWEDRAPLLETRLGGDGDLGLGLEPPRVRVIVDLVEQLLRARPEERMRDAAVLQERLEALSAGFRLHLGRRFLRGFSEPDGQLPGRLTRAPTAIDADSPLTASEEVALKTWVTEVRAAADHLEPDTEAETQIAPSSEPGPTRPQGIAPEPGPTRPQAPAPQREPTRDPRAEAGAALDAPAATEMLTAPPRDRTRTMTRPARGQGNASWIAVGLLVVGLPIGWVLADRGRGDRESAAADGAADATRADTPTEAAPTPTPPAPTPDPTLAPTPEPAPLQTAAPIGPGRASPPPLAVLTQPASGNAARVPSAPSPAAEPAWPTLRHTPPRVVLPGNPLRLALRLDGGDRKCEPEAYVAPKDGAFRRYPMRPEGDGSFAASIDIPYDGTYENGASYFLRCCEGASCSPSLGSRAAPLRIAAPAL